MEIVFHSNFNMDKLEISNTFRGGEKIIKENYVIQWHTERDCFMFDVPSLVS